jgi:hypothetical protein
MAAPREGDDNFMYTDALARKPSGSDHHLNHRFKKSLVTRGARFTKALCLLTPDFPHGLCVSCPW